MLSRLIQNHKSRPIGALRRYSTRSVNDSPFDHLPVRKTPWIKWRTVGIFFGLGSLFAYNETLYDWYETYTSIDENDHHNQELLPLQLTYKLKNLPIYLELAHPKNADKWYRLQLWENLDHNVLDKQNNTTTTVRRQKEYEEPTLTTQTLARPGGILIKPVIFHNIDSDDGVMIVHVGYKLSGYPFLVHGGMIATLLNESFKRNASLSQKTASSLKDDFMVENLSITYKAPTLANQFLIVKTQRKLYGDDKKSIVLESTIENRKGKVLVKSEAVLRDTGRASHESVPKQGWYGWK